MAAYPAIASFFRKILSGKNSDSRRILILGLDAAGKTTLLYRLANVEVVTTIPTIGFNVETVDISLSNGKSLSVTCWDVGGCDKIRPLWKHYFKDVSGVVFMVDSHDHDRFIEAREEFMLLRGEFEKPDFDGIIPPFVVFANKQDLLGSWPAGKIQEKLLETHPKSPELIKVFPLSAVAPRATFKKGINEAFIWFEQSMWNKPLAQYSAEAETKMLRETASTPKTKFDPRSPEALAEKLEDWVQRSQQDSDAEEFLRQFRDYKLPAWDHYTHIRLAYVILKTYGRQKGKNMVFDGIDAYIKNSIQTTGRSFHTTMTYFWIQMVHYAIMNMEVSSGPQVVNDFTAFLIFNPYLCDGMLWNDYYEKQVIMTPEAQQGMVLPDKKPLPNVMIRDAVKKGTV